MKEIPFTTVNVTDSHNLGFKFVITVPEVLKDGLFCLDVQPCSLFPFIPKLPTGARK